MLNEVKAFAYGIREGWEQPFGVNTTRNVDHLYRGKRRKGRDVYEWLDRGINIGQFLRAGTKSETWLEKFWPFRHDRKEKS